uniref:Uncharacterized protein n=1 Tax=Timema genevievae TaxID=629358 RepID=A0A7R9JXZ1_TIMGE|nr:unnamed protein product [Timema genevievae]
MQRCRHAETFPYLNDCDNHPGHYGEGHPQDIEQGKGHKCCLGVKDVVFVDKHISGEDGRDEGCPDAQPYDKHSVEILSQEQGLQRCIFVKHWYNLTAGVLRVHVPQITGLQGFTETLPSQGIKPREKQLGQEGSTLLRARENISELNELFPPAEDSCPWKLVTPKPAPRLGLTTHSGVVKDVLLKVTHGMIRKIPPPTFCLLRRSHLIRPKHKACRLGEHAGVGQVKCLPGREPRTPSSSLVFARVGAEVTTGATLDSRAVDHEKKGEGREQKSGKHIKREEGHQES